MAQDELEPRRGFAVGSGSRWDERRNTSQVRAPAGGALEEALRALAAYRREHPEVYAYIAAGSPPIRTQADHVRWFGRPYEAPARSRRNRRELAEP